uniref:Uncharacterized protein n=1 Tax=Spongospora subterranea TaxID=70186 RepID=A0A0H5R9M9_9EUKA|eukprot:CRZ10501.1 hypothetical protein [Spongospora subterranea]
MIIPDAYADPRFDQEYDIESSYKTTSVLVAAVRDRANLIAAVLEYRNKQDHQYVKDYFTIEHAAALHKRTLEMREILAVILDHVWAHYTNLDWSSRADLILLYRTSSAR